ncbi:hypothetical protein OAD49_01895 [Flavobacteriaceae bacterium]|nr:hypothetical protein [Flavobacteriaceae bacterium]
MEYIFIIIAFGIIGSIIYLIIRFFLKPLFFPNPFPEREVFNILNTNELVYLSHLKISKKGILEKDKLEETNPIYNPVFFNISFYKIKALSNETKKEVTLIVRWVKSYSFFIKSKITYVEIG